MGREGFEPLLPETRPVPWNDTEAIERELRGGQVAGVMLEAIQVGAGILLPAPGYFGRAQELCRKHGALLIFDEIHTGIGRTGAFLARGHRKAEPDIVRLPSGLSGPL